MRDETGTFWRETSWFKNGASCEEHQQSQSPGGGGAGSGRAGDGLGFIIGVSATSQLAVTIHQDSWGLRQPPVAGGGADTPWMPQH